MTSWLSVYYFFGITFSSINKTPQKKQGFKDKYNHPKIPNRRTTNFRFYFSLQSREMAFPDDFVWSF